MAKKYVITPDYNTIIAQFDAALTDYYDTGVTVHYTSATTIVFSCAAISDKVIRLDLASGGFKYYYGDAWTSRTTITNSVTVQSVSGTMNTNGYLVLGANFILFVDTTTNHTAILLIAKASNGKFVFITTTSSVTATYISSRSSYITDTGTRVYFLNTVGLTCEFLHPDGYLPKFPIMLIDTNQHMLINNDGSVATIDGIYFTAKLSSSIYNSSDVFVHITTHFYNNYTVIGSYSCGILVELEP